MGLPENLKSIRKKQKITQRKLAELTGISYSMISKLESGEQKNPSLSTLQLIAEQLHVSVSQLLNGDGVEWRRFLFHGTKEQQEKLEAALSKDGVSRKTIYMILKYLTINPDCQDILQKQFPDV